MKNAVFTILLMLMLHPFVEGQIDGGDFENFTFTGGDCVPNNGPALTMSASPFVACSFFGWSASHGSPEIWAQTPTTHSATMWSGRWSTDANINGEGIFASCHFRKNRKYKLRLKLACSNSASGTPNQDNFISNVYIKLANGLNNLETVSYTPTSSYYYIPTPASEQVLANYTNFNSTTWSSVDISFTADADYEDLWIYPAHSNGEGHISVLFVDDVIVDDCISYTNYTSTSSLPSYTLRGDYISASNNTNVLTGQNVIFEAGDSIMMSPSFSVQNGATFHAYLGGCDQLNCFDPSFRLASSSVVKDEMILGVSTNIFPNPNNGSFNLYTSSEDSKDVIVYDMKGNVVFTKKDNREMNLSIDISTHPKGLYLVKIISGNEIVTKKVISQ